MSILPKWHNGRVCIPWWYGLGYPLLWCAVGISFGMRYDSMIELTSISAIAMIVCAVFGALFYVVLNAISKFEKQRTDADELRAKIVQSGRDPADLSTLTVAEKWDLQKVQKFDRLFLIVDIFAVIVSAGLSVAGVVFFGEKILDPGVWQEYAVATFFIAILVAWFLDMTILKALGTAEWEKRKQDAFQAVTAAVEEAVATGMTHKDELIAKFVDAGFSKKEAEALAKEAILKELRE